MFTIWPEKVSDIFVNVEIILSRTLGLWHKSYCLQPCTYGTNYFVMKYFDEVQFAFIDDFPVAIISS